MSAIEEYPIRFGTEDYKNILLNSGVNVNLTEMATILFSKGVLNESEKQILTNPTFDNRYTAFVDIIIKKGPSYQLLVLDALIQSNCEDAAKKLTDTYQEINMEPITDKNGKFIGRIDFELSHVHERFNDKLTKLELTIVNIKSCDLLQLGKFEKLKEIKLTQMRIKREDESNMMNLQPPELKHLTTFHYDEIPPNTSQIKSYTRSLKSLFFFNTYQRKSTSCSKMNLKITLFGILLIDTESLKKSKQMMTLESLFEETKTQGSSAPETDVLILCNKNNQPIGITLQNGDVNLQSLRECLISSSQNNPESLAFLESLRINEDCRIVGGLHAYSDSDTRTIKTCASLSQRNRKNDDEQTDVHLPALQKFEIIAKVKNFKENLKELRFRNMLFFSNTSETRGCSLDAIWRQGTKVNIILNGITILYMDHDNPEDNISTLQYIAFQFKQDNSIGTLVDRDEQQSLVKTMTIIGNPPNRFRTEILQDFTFAGTFTLGLSKALSKCPKLSYVQIWNLPHNSDINHNSNGDPSLIPTDKFELRHNYRCVALSKLTLISQERSSSSPYSLQELYLHLCNLQENSPFKSTNLHDFKDTLRCVAVAGKTEKPNASLLLKLLPLEHIQYIQIRDFDWKASQEETCALERLLNFNLRTTVGGKFFGLLRNCNFILQKENNTVPPPGSPTNANIDETNEKAPESPTTTNINETNEEASESPTTTNINETNAEASGSPTTANTDATNEEASGSPTATNTDATNEDATEAETVPQPPTPTQCWKWTVETPKEEVFLEYHFHQFRMDKFFKDIAVYKKTRPAVLPTLV